MASAPFDASEFLRGLDHAQRALVMPAATMAVNVFGVMVQGNAQELVPKDTGALAASGTGTDAKMEGDRITAVVGFNTDYAAARHERPPEQAAQPDKNPKGQWKFLETAMRLLAPKFGPFVAGRIKAALDSDSAPTASGPSSGGGGTDAGRKGREIKTYTKKDGTRVSGYRRSK